MAAGCKRLPELSKSLGIVPRMSGVNVASVAGSQIVQSSRPPEVEPVTRRSIQLGLQRRFCGRRGIGVCRLWRAERFLPR